MTGIDLAVMALYFTAVLAIGTYFTRQQKDAADYFLGQHDIPWWAVMLSIVATETSALTVISIPGVAAGYCQGISQGVRKPLTLDSSRGSARPPAKSRPVCSCAFAPWATACASLPRRYRSTSSQGYRFLGAF